MKFPRGGMGGRSQSKLFVGVKGVGGGGGGKQHILKVLGLVQSLNFTCAEPKAD